MRLVIFYFNSMVLLGHLELGRFDTNRCARFQCYENINQGKNELHKLMQNEHTPARSLNDFQAENHEFFFPLVISK